MVLAKRSPRFGGEIPRASQPSWRKMCHPRIGGTLWCPTRMSSTCWGLGLGPRSLCHVPPTEQPGDSLLCLSMVALGVANSSFVCVCVCCCVDAGLADVPFGLREQLQIVRIPIRHQRAHGLLSLCCQHKCSLSRACSPAQRLHSVLEVS